jgi:exodeoxyribonuclease III
MCRVLTVASANVNGVRAAQRRGGVAWLAAQDADVVCLQEVRATDEQLAESLAGTGLAAYRVAHTEAATLGRAGVAILSRTEPTAIRYGVGRREFATAGRWVEVDLATDAGPLTVVSTYLPTGEARTPRQLEKQRFLDAMSRRMGTLRRLTETRGGFAVVTGDLNIAHAEADLKNWLGNRGKSGWLPEERAYLDRWLARDAWVDVTRRLHGVGPGPYSWWSWRGQAFDTDTGWRIDYQLATRELAARAVSCAIGRAASYAERWSDHAAVVARYDLTLA